jgi:hypothetical protein
MLSICGLDLDRTFKVFRFTALEAGLQTLSVVPFSLTRLILPDFKAFLL